MTRRDRQGLARRNEQGSAALVVTLILFFVMTLIAAFANRNLVFEHRASVNQYRSTQAFEAAEAGLEWATAMLNNPHPVNDACVAGSDATLSFRDRFIVADPATGAIRPATMSSGVPTMPKAVCVKSADAWRCSCQGGVAPAASSAAPEPAFTVQFAPEPQPGALKVLATGCTTLAGACLPGSARRADATAHVQVTLGWVPALASIPAAALTAKDALNAGASALGVHNTDADSGGVTVHAGRTVTAVNARLTTVPGGLAEASVVDNDASLQALDAPQLFVSCFGIGRALWRQQPGVKVLRCEGDCTSAVLSSIDAGHRMLWLDGEAQVSGAVAIGHRQRPVAIVASTSLRLVGPVDVHGLVYAGSLAWTGAAGGKLHGAAISESGFTAEAAADLIHDTPVLTSLKTGAGSFARVPGSWKDF